MHLVLFLFVMVCAMLSAYAIGIMSWAFIPFLVVTLFAGAGVRALAAVADDTWRTFR